MDDGTRGELIARFATDLEQRLAALRDGVAADVARLPSLEPAPAPDDATAPPGPTRPEPPPVATPDAPVEPTAPATPDASDASDARPRGGRGRRVVAGLGVALVGLLLVVVLVVSVGPLFLPYGAYVVRSGSMEPAIPTGAMVAVTERDGAALRAGDVITFTAPGGSQRVTHRIVEVIVEDSDGGDGASTGRRAFVTKGDANADADHWLVPATGTIDVVRFQVPYVGYVFGWLATPPVRVALVAVPLVAVVVVGWRRRARRAGRSVRPPAGAG
ncbi:MAG TPA: signal peptidase I [Acidimicrobiales bacterium]|nr:signal peptidase I [Acidimicrobiales bacterium]